MIRYLLFFLAFLVAGSIQAQQVTLSVTTDRRAILIGEPLVLEVALAAPAAVAPLVLDSLPYFEVLEAGKADTLREGAGFIVKQQWRLTSWDSGRRQIPALQYNGQSSRPIPILVSFSSPFDKNQPYHDIKDVENVELPARNTWVWYVVLVILLIGIAALLFPKRKGEAPRAIRVDEQYYKKVLQQLQVLQQDEARRRVPKQFYTDLLSILRGYLYNRKGYYSDADTTTDLVTRLPQWRLPAHIQEELRATLQESDLVKFAKYQPADSQMDAAVQTFKRAVVALEEHSR